MQLGSSTFSDGDMVPRRYTCDGEDLSPPLIWNNPPAETKSFVLLCDDPDAPSGTFHHWALYDLPADRRELEEGADRNAATAGLRRGVNDFQELGYRGPCPPHRHGPHHYRFRLLALSVAHLPLPERPSCRDVERAALKHALVEARLVAIYER